MPATDRPLVHELRFANLASGARIAWARSGRVGAPVLLRAAHWMTHVDHDLRSPLWRPLVEQLGHQFEVVRYDERGCVLSTADAVPLGLDASVEELEAVAQAHGGRTFALLGISGGAGAAVAFAARHPERVSHLVLLAGGTHGLLHRNPSPQSRAFHEAQLKLIELGWGRHDPGVQHISPVASCPMAVRSRSPRSTSASACAAMACVPRPSFARAPGSTCGRFEIPRSRNHIPLQPEPAFDRLCQAITEFVAARPPAPLRTPRERALAGHVAQGLDNLQMAVRLGVADKAVRNMLSALYTKLGVEGRPMAVVKARDLGL